MAKIGRTFNPVMEKTMGKTTGETQQATGNGADAAFNKAMQEFVTNSKADAAFDKAMSKTIQDWNNAARPSAPGATPPAQPAGKVKSNVR